jgi:hypothetical protein
MLAKSAAESSKPVNRLIPSATSDKLSTLNSVVSWKVELGTPETKGAHPPEWRESSALTAKHFDEILPSSILLSYSRQSM